MAQEVIKEPRDFPAVEELLQHRQLIDALSQLPRPIAASIVKHAVASAKQRLLTKGAELPLADLLTTIRTALYAAKRQEVTRVINATGIIVHTNLGRAPLPEIMFDSLRSTLTGYCNVEFNLASGTRGERGVACEKYLAALSEAGAGTIVNNCAASLFLILNTLANRRKVLISRGELVQIGGGFRIPDILKRAGARLAEVGTTNITTLADYESRIDDQTALILKVHKSNFIQAGFTEEVALKDLVDLGNRHAIPVVNDLGSGVFVDTRDIIGYSEPTVQQSVRTGTALTCFSGDKLLGGMQAGLIVGHTDYVARLKKNPLFRTVRVDKVVFTVIERLLASYLNGTYATDITLWSRLQVSESELYQRGKGLLRDAGNPPGVSVEATKAYIGGGALPEQDIASVGVIFAPEYKAEKLMMAFRMAAPPIIGRIDNDRFVLDLKTVAKEDYPHLLVAIRSATSR